MADYAEEMLGGKPSSQVDYASEVLGNSAQRTLSDYEITPGKGASFATLSKAAMVDDPQTKLKIFASDRFPDDPKAVERYGILDGEVIYSGDDGKIYQETPSGFLGGAKDFLAGVTGKSPTIAGAAAGAIAGAPLGVIGAIPGAIAGAMGGEGLRKTIANVALDEPQTSVGNFKAMAGEGAYAAIGEFLGSGLASALERNLARDIKRLNKPQMAALESKANKAGIELFPPQVTDLRSMKGRYEAVARLDAGADIVGAAERKQAEQANTAAYNYFSTLSKGSAGDSASRAQDAAKDIVNKLDKERAALAGPFYKRAFQKSVETTPELAALADTPIMQEALATAKRLAKNEGLDLKDPKNTMLGLHWTKMALDNMIEGAGAQGVGGVERRQMIDMKNKLLGFMDKADVNYGLGRYFYAGESAGIGKAEAGVVGKLVDQESNLPKLGRSLFSPSSDPSEIRNAKRLFTRYGKQDEWNGLVKGYLQDAFEMAGRFDDGIMGQAPRFRKQMLGNPRQRDILRSAMTPDQFQGLSDLSDVFEAMGRVKGTGGSQTMPLQEGARALRSDAEGVLGKAVTPVKSIKDWIVEARLGKHAEKVAEILTTPGDVMRLKELKRLSPNDRKFIAGVSALLGLSAAPSGADEVQNPQLGQKQRLSSQ